MIADLVANAIQTAGLMMVGAGLALIDVDRIDAWLIRGILARHAAACDRCAHVPGIGVVPSPLCPDGVALVRRTGEQPEAAS